MTLRLPRPDTPVLDPNGSFSRQWLKALTATNDAVNGVISATIYTDTGSVNAMKIATGAAALTRGMIRYLSPAFTNTNSAVTLNDSGLGAKAVKFPDGTLPAVGQIVMGVTLQVIYDGVNYEIQNLSTANQSIPGNLLVAGALTVDGTSNLIGSVTANGGVSSTGTIAAGTLTATASISAGTFIKTGSGLVSALPSAVTSGAGARSFVTDATVTTFNSIVAGTGGNKVPVVSDGTNWLIG
jgi:hypothetical protein